MIGTEQAALDTPALLIDLDTMEGNLSTMAGFFKDTHAKLRPHAKTHKSPVIAHKQLALGAVGITCAKLGEAEAMVEAGVPDILVANQIIGAVKIARLVALAHHTRITVAADDPANLRAIATAATAAGVEIGILVEVNTGMNRCGVEPGEAAVSLAALAADLTGIRFRGVQAYEGHLVNTENEDDTPRGGGSGDGPDPRDARDDRGARPARGDRLRWRHRHVRAHGRAALFR